MASTLRILPEIETKSLVCEGIIAVREAVALTVVMPPGSMESGDDIHVRIRGKLGDVAKFPFDDEDEWTATPDDAGNTVLTATLNCNTDALIKSFRFIPENGKMTFLVAVENDTQNCLVARGRVTVMNWIGDGDMQDPVTIESELAEIAELKRLVETKVIDSVEQSGGRIIFTFGDGSTWESDDLTGPPGPAGVSMSDIREAFADVPTTYSSQRAIGTALGRVVKTLQEFGLCLVAFLALAASATEWQDVPATTVIGEGLTVTNGEIRAAGGGGLDGQAVTNIVVAGGYTITNEVRFADADGNRLTIWRNNNGDKEIYVRDMSLTYRSEYNSLSFKNTDLWLDSWELLYGGYQSLPDYIEEKTTPYARADALGTAAFKDASEFATAADEALIYQLITNRLSGVTFDFATVAGLYLTISNIVAAQGGSITNFPAIP